MHFQGKLRLVLLSTFFAGSSVFSRETGLSPAAANDAFNLRISVDKDTVFCGDIVRVTITLRNDLGSPALENVIIRTVFPNLLTAYTAFIDVVRAPNNGGEPVFSFIPPNLRWNIGSLAPGESDTISYRLQVVLAPGEETLFNYIVTADAQNADNSQTAVTNIFNPARNDQCARGGGGALPDLAVDDSLDTVTACFGDTLNFTVTVRNKRGAGVTAREVYVTWSIPGDSCFELLEASISPEPLDIRKENGFHVIRWLFPVMPPGSGRELRVSVVVIKNPKTPNSQIARTVATHNRPDRDSADNEDRTLITIIPKYDLVLTYLGADEGGIDPGATESYQLRVRNNSTVEVSDVMLITDIDDGNPTANCYSITGITDNGLPNIAQDRFFWEINTIPPGDSVDRAFTLTYDNINLSNPGQIIAFDAVVDSMFLGSLDTNTVDNYEHWERTKNNAFDLILTADKNRDLNIGEAETFALTLKNNSQVALPGFNLRVQITPVFPATLANITISNISDGATESGGVIVWSFSGLDAGAEAVRSFTATINSLNASGDFCFDLQCDVDVIPGETDTLNNSASGQICAPALPTLFLTSVEAPSGRVAPDGDISCTFTYGNSGNYLALNAELVVTFPDNSTRYVDWTLEQGAVQSSATPGERRANVGDLPPGGAFTATVTFKAKSLAELREEYPGENQQSVPVPIAVSLSAQNTPVSATLDHNTILDIPPIKERFFLTRNRFRPADETNMRMYFAPIQDANVGFKIYNVAGDLVKSFPRDFVAFDDEVSQFWDGLNDRGQPVGSGLYYVFADADYNHRQPSRKVIVIR